MWVVDVVDMYNSLHNKFWLEALSFWHGKYPELKDSRFSTEFILTAMQLTLENNVGYFAGNFYKQANGTATGIEPAPPYARSGRFFLNIINNSIKFTASCSTKEIVFLDVGVLKTENGFETIVFNKETDADNYLNFTSCHPRHTKENIR